MVKVVSSARMASSALAFGSSSNQPFLAAGSAPGSPNPGVAFFRVAASSPGVDLLQFVGRVPSPAMAACCRLSWSHPTEATCSSAMLPTGLLAAGLENGSVAVWDPRKMLGYSESASTRLIEGYFLPSKSLQFDSSTYNLVESAAASDSEVKWISEPDIIEDYFTPTSTSGQKPATRSVSGPPTKSRDEHGTSATRSGDEDGTWMLPFNIIEDYLQGPPPAPGSSFEDMVALLSCHSKPVNGLAFSPTTPHFLASAAQENIMLWDLVNCREKNIPSLQLTEADDVKIAYLSWSCDNPNIMTSASNTGISLWDITMKAPLLRKFSNDQTYSVVKWNPMDRNIIVGASGSDSDFTTVKVWDVRKMDPPVSELCGDMKGIIALDWSPFHEDVILACTGNRKVLIVNAKKGEILLEDESPDTCLDIQWSKYDAGSFALATSEEIKMCRKAQD